MHHDNSQIITINPENCLPASYREEFKHKAESWKFIGTKPEKDNQ